MEIITFALNVYIDAVSLDQFDAFEPGSAAQATGFFVYDGDLVTSLEERCYRSGPHSTVSDDDDLHLCI